MRSALVLGALSLALCGPAGAAESWVEVKTANFTLVSNAGEGTARQTVWEFEQVRAAYARLWPWAKLAEGRPAVVLALKDETTLKRWAPKYYEGKGGLDLVSVTAHGADRDYMLLRTNSRPNQAEVTPSFNLYRAYLGTLFSASFEHRLPLWLSNGLAEVFGNTFVRDKEVHVGRPVPWHVRRLNQHARLPLRAILEAQPGSPLVLQDDQRDQFDAQCWVLVHYLSFGDQGAHVPRLNRFLALWLAGKPHEQALSEALGDLTALEKQLPVYTSRSILPFGRLLADVGIDRQKLPVRVVPPAEALSLQAAVHVAMSRPVEAQAAIQAAVAADPQAAGSYDAAGLLADLQNEREKAAQAYTRAGEMGSTSAYSYYRAAQLAWKPAADPATLAASRQLLERAVALNDKLADAHSFLAEVLTEQKAGQAALPLARRAVALEPGESYHHLALARVLHALGQPAAAQAEAQRGLELASNERQRGNAQRLLDFLSRSTAHERQRATQAAERSQGEACQAGDAAACAQLLVSAERECAAGQAAACSLAAWLHAQGPGIAHDLAKSAALVERACGAGDRRACVEHAWRLARGEGLARDEARAQAQLEALCAEELWPACSRLAMLHAGRPGASDHARAKELLTLACQGGEQEACSLAQAFE